MVGGDQDARSKSSKMIDPFKDFHAACAGLVTEKRLQKLRYFRYLVYASLYLLDE